MQERSSQYSFKYLITIVILLIAILFISLFSFYSFSGARESLLEKDRAVRNQTEQQIDQSVILLDKGLRLFDATFDYRLEQAFIPFLEEYERSGRDPSRMDLAGVKQTIESRMEGTVDLYLINEEDVIEYTTYAPDQGLDFKQWPDVHTFLTNLRQGDAFSADRIVYGPSMILRKYAYMPSPDHRYLLELGLVVERYKEEREDFSYKKVAENAILGNPNVLDLHFYDSTGRMIGRSDYRPDDEVIDHVLEVYESEEPVVTEDVRNQTSTRFLYLDLDIGEYASAPEMNIIAQVVYSTAELDAALSDLLSSHLLIAILAIFTGIVFAFFTSYFVSRPITGIIEDVERIAGGDLDHQIGSGGGTEFARLRQSINTMVATLKQNIAQIRKSEAKIKCYSENLEEMVNRRTETLRRESEEMQILIDIITQNIHLSTTLMGSSLQLLAERQEGDMKALTKQALESARESKEIIRSIEILRRIYTEQQPLKQVNLDAAIDEAAGEYPDIDLQFEKSGARVVADDILPELFGILFEQARRRGGAGVTIRIRTETQEGEVGVTVSDSGPPLPHEIVREVLEAPEPGLVPGRGLGLSIARSMAEWYRGRMTTVDGEVKITFRRAG
ncbi:MAG: HAMP domain-containing protein [Methanomicrobiaceae archaeon]|nr:HAMP domain-containing protein [Methanomicrobiaceae archaeon]